MVSKPLNKIVVKCENFTMEIFEVIWWHPCCWGWFTVFAVMAHKTTARWYIWIYSFRLVFPNFPLGFLLLKVHTKAHWLLKAALGGTLEKWSKKNQSQQTAARQRLRKTVIARRENKLNPFTIKKCLLGHLLFHFVQCCCCRFHCQWFLRAAFCHKNGDKFIISEGLFTCQK